MNYRRQCGTFQFDEDVFSKVAEKISKIYHEVILIMKFLQTKPQVKKMYNNFHNLYHTVIKNKVQMTCK